MTLGRRLAALLLLALLLAGCAGVAGSYSRDAGSHRVPCLSDADRRHMSGSYATQIVFFCVESP